MIAPGRTVHRQSSETIADVAAIAAKRLERGCPAAYSWRTFFLLAFLITASMAVWVSSIRVVERAPRARVIAAQVVSIGDGDPRRGSTAQLRVWNATPTIARPSRQRRHQDILRQKTMIRLNQLPATTPNAWRKLNPKSALTGSTNPFRRARSTTTKGFLTGFDIEGDLYWLGPERARIEHTSGIEWLGHGGRHADCFDVGGRCSCRA